MDKVSDNFKTIFQQSKAKDAFWIDQAKLVEYATEKNMYFDIANMDPKKKQPEGVPTELTSQILSDALHQIIEEYDLGGRKHKKDVLEAQKAGKEVPADPRYPKI